MSNNENDFEISFDDEYDENGFTKVNIDFKNEDQCKRFERLLEIAVRRKKELNFHDIKFKIEKDEKGFKIKSLTET